jgi:hypothetical protein
MVATFLSLISPHAAATFPAYSDWKALSREALKACCLQPEAVQYQN